MERGRAGSEGALVPSARGRAMGIPTERTAGQVKRQCQEALREECASGVLPMAPSDFRLRGYASKSFTIRDQAPIPGSSWRRGKVTTTNQPLVGEQHNQHVSEF